MTICHNFIGSMTAQGNKPHSFSCILKLLDDLCIFEESWHTAEHFRSCNAILEECGWDFSFGAGFSNLNVFTEAHLFYTLRHGRLDTQCLLRVLRSLNVSTKGSTSC